MATADIVNAISSIYQDQLGRAPDPAGLAYYADQIASGQKSIDQVNAEINRSSEGAAYDTQTVRNLYTEGLGREADAGGLSYWVNQLQSGNVAPEGVARVFYETAIGKGGESTEAGRAAAARGLLDIATEQQLGKDISAADRNFVASYTDKLLNQGATLDQIAKELNRSTEGVNFDTQAISAIYRQQFGRDAEQEGYQYYMSRLQNEGLTPAQAKAAIMGGAAGKDVAAMASRAEASLTAQNPYRNLIETNVFEADPYGGRFYTRSPYDLGKDAVNVSTLADGTRVQWNAPITQNAKVTGYDAAGNFTVKEGQPTINAGEVNAAIKRAVAAGTLTDTQATEIATRIRDSVSGAKDASEAAKTLNNFYGILDDYTTKVAIDPIYGIQTGQGSTADIAMKNYQNLSNLIATNERMPSIPQLGSQVITDARGTGPSREDYIGPLKAGQLPTSYTDFLRINPMTGKVEQVTGGTFAGGDITGPRPFYAYNTVDTTGNVVTPQNYQNTVAGVSTLLQRPTYAPVTFTGAGTPGAPGGTPAIEPLTTYADLALLSGAAPGAPTVVGVPAYGTYSGVPTNPVTGQPMIEAARPTTNVSPAGLGAREISSMIASSTAPGMKEGGLAALANQVRDAGRGNDTILAHINPEEAGILKALGGRGTINPHTGLPEFDWWSKNITRKIGPAAKQVAKVLPFVVPFIPGLQAFAPYISGIAGAFGGEKGFDLKRGLMSGLTAYGIGQLAQGAQTAGSIAAGGGPAELATVAGPEAAATAAPSAVPPPATPSVPQFRAELPAGSTIGDYAKATLGNIETAGRGIGQALTPGAQGATARNIIGQSFGPGTAFTTLSGVSGVSAIDEAEKFRQQQAALDEEEEQRQNRLRGLAFANMQANPYRLIAEGGYIDDNPVTDMAAGGLKEGSFIVPADVVAHLGNGSSEAGLKMLSKRYGATPIKGPGDGMSDSIPTTIEGRQRARVADGEAIISPAMTAKVGPKQLYSMLDKVRKARTGTTKQGRQINPMRYLPA